MNKRVRKREIEIEIEIERECVCVSKVNGGARVILSVFRHSYHFHLYSPSLSLFLSFFLCHFSLPLAKALAFFPGILLVVVLFSVISYSTNAKDNGIAILDTVEVRGRKREWAD